jgi:hypothetical protein
MRIATALFLVVVLLALPACRMNERMSGTAFGGIGGAVVGGALGGSFAGGVVGGLAGGVLGYLVGDYLADKRERCSPCAPTAYPQTSCDPCASTWQPAPQYAPAQVEPPCAPPTNYATGPQVGAVRSRNPNVAAARQAIERGRRAATLPEARAAYERAVRLDPQSADAWNALGLALGTSGDRAAADEAFRRALALDPHHYAARQNLGWAGSGTR